MEYKHFSHEHNLILHQVQDGQTIRCSGCESLCHGTAYACWQCNYFLHDYCGNANRYVKHPSHTLHPLILVPKPTYCSGSFICNACGETGSSFSYCCALCEVDLHVGCTFLPLKVIHKSHQHDLKLYIGVADKKDVPDEFCKICTKLLDTKHWSYFCVDCDFGVHTFCATTEVKPGLYVDDLPDSDETEAAPPQQNGSGGDNKNEPSAEEVIAELYNMRLQMQMVEQLAKMAASFNPSSYV